MKAPKSSGGKTVTTSLFIFLQSISSVINDDENRHTGWTDLTDRHTGIPRSVENSSSMYPLLNTVKVGDMMQRPLL